MALSKTTIAAKIAEVQGITKKQTEEIVNNIFTMIAENLAAGEKIAIHGFGTFEVKQREARKGRNPQTGAEIEIPARLAPVFKASSTLKDAVQK